MFPGFFDTNIPERGGYLGSTEGRPASAAPNGYQAERAPIGGNSGGTFLPSFPPPKTTPFTLLFGGYGGKGGNYLSIS